VRRERVAEVRRWLSNYQELKEAIEAFASSIMICCVRNGLHRRRGESSMIEMRRAQLNFGDGLIAEVSERSSGGLDETRRRGALGRGHIAALYKALARRHPKSRSRGRLGTPAEMVLRLLILKHIRNWSYGVLEREGRANHGVPRLQPRRRWQDA
jgi:hypothetical protein